MEGEGATNRQLVPLEGTVGDDRQAQPAGALPRQRVRTFSCSLCSERFAGFNERHAHYISVHTAPLITKPGGKSKTYPCALCEEIFQTTKARRVHYLHYHTTSLLGETRVVTKNYPCALCDEVFQTTMEKRAHYLDKHVPEPEPGILESEAEIPSHHLGSGNTGVSLPMDTQGWGSLQQDSSSPDDCGRGSFQPRAERIIQERLVERQTRHYTCEDESCKERFGNLAEMNYHVVTSHTHMGVLDLASTPGRA